MKILLVQNSLYFPAYGGGNRSNRLLLEALAQRGHTCHVVTRVSESLDPGRLHEFLADLEARRIRVRSYAGGLVIFSLNGVEVHTQTTVPKLRSYLVRHIRSFQPSWTLVSSDDPLQIFLRAALEAASARVVYLARATLALPFGPDSVMSSPEKTETLRRVAGVATVSRYAMEYIERWSGIPSTALPISLHGAPPFPNLGCFEQGYVTLVNPCAVKGISIFLELARRFRAWPFAAVPTWGTNEADQRALQEVPNIMILPPVEDIEEILSQTRVVLVPSLCADAKPRIVSEAMARGIPVIASNVGGIAEAKLGVEYLLSVNPIERYEAQIDNQMVPRAAIPEQDITPWEQALRRLLNDRAHYEDVSIRSHQAAADAISRLTVEPFESWLEQLSLRVPEAGHTENAGEAPGQTELTGHSPEKRALIAMRLRNQRKNA